ncbi:MAG: alpha/beta fold hydrolase [Nonomuraea sp.]|nr:alpha/beta fold hydrolase [Nonomuraea sp.]
MDAVVFGATGFIGRWTVLHLLEQGRTVAAVVRRPNDELPAWLDAHGAPAGRLTLVTGDLSAGPGLGLSAADDERLADVRDVFNTAGVYRFGMEREEARAVNVDGALNVLSWAATRPGLRRLVHVSGYRVGLDPHPEHPFQENGLYRSVGAYEASKTEGDAAVRVVAARLGVPLTVVNPSSVIGHSVTGEAGQYIGLAGLVRDLWAGRLPALPGSARTFVPVVTVDYFARFMAAIPEHDPEPGGLHWVLDPATPDLPDLIRLLAAHLGVRAPRRHLPVSVIRRLPAALTGADPETLAFLTEDRYDTASADKVAASAGLRHPPVDAALRRWADRLVADRFGATPAALATDRSGASPAAPATDRLGASPGALVNDRFREAPAARSGGFQGVGGSRTYLSGDRVSPAFVFLHGLPLDGDSWQGVLGELGEPPALVADLPGLGRSSPATATPQDWLAELLSPVRTRPVLVAHSAAAAPALRYAAAHPERVPALVLLSPAVLQRRPSALLHTPFLAAPLLRRIPAGRLATSLLGPDPTGDAREAVTAAAGNLRRSGVARRTARHLRETHRPAERAELRALLQALLGGPVPVHLIVGETDPLVDDPGKATLTSDPGETTLTNDPGETTLTNVPAATVAATVTVIPAAGHHAHLTHPAAVAEAVRRASA